MKKTYFDLENTIYQCFQTSDDLELYLKAHIDGPEAFDEDKQMNILTGIIEMNNLRCTAVMDMMCRVFELNEYCNDPEKLAAREAVLAAIQSKKKGKK
jgi:hypothetical protein